MRTREDDFKYQVKLMAEKFIKDYGIEEIEEDFDGDISEAIWKEKEMFGEIVYNIICEYFGSEIFEEVYEEEKNKEQ